MSRAGTSSAAIRLQRRSKAWGLGAAEAKLLDREHARHQTYEQRISEGLALIRIADKLQAGRTGRPVR